MSASKEPGKPTPGGAVGRGADVSTEKKSAERPTISTKLGSKISTTDRHVCLNIMIDECLKVHPDEAKAYERALAEERKVYEDSQNEQSYLDVAADHIKHLRSEVTCAGSPSSENDPKHERTTAARASNSRDKSKPNPHVLKAGEFYDRLRAYILTEEEQVENSYPRLDPDHPGRATICTDTEKIKRSVSPIKDERICNRCKQTFPVDANGECMTQETCTYHWGKNRKIHTSRNSFVRKWTCCDKGEGATGCEVHNRHVHLQNYYDDLEGYVRMPEAMSTPEDGNYGIYSLDCEMVYTTAGLEIGRVTVVDMQGQPALEELVLPDHPIIDYNTRFSGISEEDMKSVTTSPRDVQAMLSSLFSSNNILIGHSLESDFIALKITHDKVVDSSVVFPHRQGKPYKLALRMLIKDKLQRHIQQRDGGHDSLEDAVACMDLIRWRVNKDVKEETRRAHSLLIKKLIHTEKNK